MKKLFFVLLFIPSLTSAKGLFTPNENPELWCLAQNIYYEARSSNLADQAAVADVVLNRVNDNRYPDTICGVVRQGDKNMDGTMVRNRCAFSWYCDGKSDWPKEDDSWLNAQYIAWNIVFKSTYRGITEGSTHYHAHHIEPYWADSLQLVGRIGEHIYYRWL